jgi:predicted dehydrogenase
MKTGIVGCGKFAEKRAEAMGDDLIACFDVDYAKARDFAKRHNCIMVEYLPDLYSAVDAVVVSTNSGSLYINAKQAIEAGKHVLVEKPGATKSEQIKDLIYVSQKEKVLVQVGFNHRFHPAFMTAKRLIFLENQIGKVNYVHGTYGHGGREGYGEEWRGKASEGGGEGLDKGVHLIDLASLFMGAGEITFPYVEGKTATYHWGMNVEDNIFMLLKTNNGRIAMLNSSSTDWRNTFRFDILGETGKISIEGLGGSYGTEKLTLYEMVKGKELPEVYSWEFLGKDESLKIEYDCFVRHIKQGRSFYETADLYDALKAIDVIERIKANDNH